MGNGKASSQEVNYYLLLFLCFDCILKTMDSFVNPFSQAPVLLR